MKNIFVFIPQRYLIHSGKVMAYIEQCYDTIGPLIAIQIYQFTCRVIFVRASPGSSEVLAETVGRQ